MKLTYDLEGFTLTAENRLESQILRLWSTGTFGIGNTGHECDKQFPGPTTMYIVAKRP